MNKILIQSKYNIQEKEMFKKRTEICGVCAGILLVICLFTYFGSNNWHEQLIYTGGLSFRSYMNPQREIYELLSFYGSIILFIIAGWMYYVYKAQWNSGIIVMDTAIQGSEKFGRSVNISIRQISAVSLMEKNHGIQIMTTHTSIQFYNLEDYKTVYAVICRLIGNGDYAPTTQATTDKTTDDIERLRMLKQLMITGIISAEDFEKKKREILS